MNILYTKRKLKTTSNYSHSILCLLLRNTLSECKCMKEIQGGFFSSSVHEISGGIILLISIFYLNHNQLKIILAEKLPFGFAS